MFKLLHNFERSLYCFTFFCDCALTVVHILLECHYDSIRQRYFSVATLKELFDTIFERYIVEF